MQYKRSYAGTLGWTSSTSNTKTLKEITTPKGHKILFQTWDEQVVSAWGISHDLEIALLWIPELGAPMTDLMWTEAGDLFCKAGMACRSEFSADSWHAGYICWERHLLDSPSEQPKILEAVTKVANNLDLVDQAIETALDATVYKRSAFDKALATL